MFCDQHLEKRSNAAFFSKLLASDSMTLPHDFYTIEVRELQKEAASSNYNQLKQAQNTPST